MKSIGLGVVGCLAYASAILANLFIPYIARMVLMDGGDALQALYGPLYAVPSLIALLGIGLNAVGLVFGIASFRGQDSPRMHSYAGLAINGLPCCLAVLACIGIALLIAAFSGGTGFIPH